MKSAKTLIGCIAVLAFASIGVGATTQAATDLSAARDFEAAKSAAHIKYVATVEDSVAKFLNNLDTIQKKLGSSPDSVDERVVIGKEMDQINVIRKRDGGSRTAYDVLDHSNLKEATEAQWTFDQERKKASEAEDHAIQAAIKVEIDAVNSAAAKAADAKEWTEAERLRNVAKSLESQLLPNSVETVAAADERNIVCLCDSSGSMINVFSSLKKQLKLTVGKMGDAQRFNIIFFGDGEYVPLFKDGTHIATVDAKHKAFDFIDNINASGVIKVVPAIKFAFGEKPDTVYVFTNGFEQANTGEIITAFKDANAKGKARVNCVFLPSDIDERASAQAALQQIADDGGGTLKSITE